jgi:hypothetical protein
LFLAWNRVVFNQPSRFQSQTDIVIPVHPHLSQRSTSVTLAPCSSRAVRYSVTSFPELARLPASLDIRYPASCRGSKSLVGVQQVAARVKRT